jgi:hypothetical protein
MPVVARIACALSLTVTLRTPKIAPKVRFNVAAALTVTAFALGETMVGGAAMAPK